MRDDLTRIIVAQWNRIKNKFPTVIPRDDMTPKFGTIIDAFREQYGIYIDAVPSVISTSNIVTQFRSNVFKLEENIITDSWTGTEQSYFMAIREAIDEAYEMIGE